jgi:hypothetical protein
MRLTAAIAAIFFAQATCAIAEDKPADKPLTVNQAISIWNVLNDKSFADFKFGGATRMAFARDIEVTYGVLRNYQEQVTKTRLDMAGAPGKDVPKEKIDDLNAESNKMLDAPAYVTLAKVKLSDLCLDAPQPPACPVKNEISPSMLAGLLPIIEQ